MKRLIVVAVLVGLLSACVSQKTYVPVGAFYGILPCADCSGLHYELTLGDDNTYSEKAFYQGKSSHPSIHSGTYEVLQSKVITLSDKSAEEGMRQFVIEGDKLRMLTKTSGPVEGALAEKYVLSKDKPEGFTMEVPDNMKGYSGDKRLHDIWVVLELKGNPINVDKKPDIEFNLKENKVFGFSGCNQFTGEIEVQENTIKFGMLAGTRRACPDMSLEDEFLKLITDKKLDFSFSDRGLLLESEDGSVLLQKVD